MAAVSPSHMLEASGLTMLHVRVAYIYASHVCNRSLVMPHFAKNNGKASSIFSCINVTQFWQYRQEEENVFIIAGLLLTGLKAVFILLPTIELIDNQTKILRGVLEKLGSCHRCTALGTAADDPKDEHRVEHGWFRFGNVLIHTFFIFCQCFSLSRKRYRLPQWSFG